MTTTATQPRLTQDLIKRLGATGKKQRIPDHEVKGLSLRIAPAGKMSWAIRYRDLARQSKEMKVGDVPAMTLKQARAAAMDKLANVHNGGDPLRERREAVALAKRERTNTLNAIADEFYAAPAFTSLSVGTQDYYEVALRLNILPAIGVMPIAFIGRREVARLQDKLITDHSISIAARARRTLSAVMSFAMERELVDFNPVAMVKLKQKVEPRTRTLSDEEIRAVWEAAESKVGVFQTVADILLLSLILPARASEICGMEWGELDLVERTWTIPADRMKASASHQLPLTEMALTVLRRRQGDGAQGQWVFPNRAGSSAMCRRRHGRACSRFAVAWGWEPFGPHDLRRTIATRLAKLGVVKEINQRLLGHKVGSGEAILHYDHHDYAEQKRVALELWESELTNVLTKDG